MKIKILIIAILVFAYQCVTEAYPILSVTQVTTYSYNLPPTVTTYHWRTSVTYGNYYNSVYPGNQLYGVCDSKIILPTYGGSYSVGNNNSKIILPTYGGYYSVRAK